MTLEEKIVRKIIELADNRVVMFALELVRELQKNPETVQTQKAILTAVEKFRKEKYDAIERRDSTTGANRETEDSKRGGAPIGGDSEIDSQSEEDRNKKHN